MNARDSAVHIRGAGRGATAVLAALLLLAGCDRAGDRETVASLESRRETLERRASGCDGKEECDSVTIEWQLFGERPALNSAIREQLVKQLQENGEERVSANSLEAVADAFLTEAAKIPDDISSARWELTGEAKRLARRGDLLTVAINTYIYTGGAHGLPVTHWLNWDLAADRPVSLRQVIQPEREREFWNRAEEAHRRWLEQQDVDDDFRRTWPFQKTGDFRFDDSGLVLLYGVYALAPYAAGQVELKLPWEELRGVVRDKYLPD